MTLPVAFDHNEWFLIITQLLVLAVFLRLPRRLPRTMTILIFVITFFFGKTADTIFGAKPLDFYNINDTEGYDLFDLLTWIIYTFFGYFLIYFYDRFQPSKRMLFVYVYAWSLFSVAYEWVAFKMGVFHYIDWQITYSFTFYLIVISIVLLYYRLINHMFLKMKQLKRN